MDPNSQVGSSPGSTWNWTNATGLTTQKSQNVENGPVLQPKTQHLKFIILAPIKYLSSDCIVTWSILRLCHFSRSFTILSQICDQINIRWVAIENLRISNEIWSYFTVIKLILVRSQIWQREVEELLMLHNLHIDHVMIQSKLRYITGGEDAGNAKWNRSAVPTRSTWCGFMSSPGNHSALVTQVGLLGGSWPWTAAFGSVPTQMEAR